MIINCFFVGIGGFVGSVFRYLISLIPFLKNGSLPLATLAVNVAGAVIIGIIVKEAESAGSFNEQTLLFLKVGLCGGFTTFSTFALESFELFQGGRLLLTGIYIAASVFLCIGGIALGRWIAG